MANMLFAPDGMKVVEIVPQAWRFCLSSCIHVSNAERSWRTARLLQRKHSTPLVIANSTQKPCLGRLALVYLFCELPAELPWILTTLAEQVPFKMQDYHFWDLAAALNFTYLPIGDKAGRSAFFHRETLNLGSQDDPDAFCFELWRRTVSW